MYKVGAVGTGAAPSFESHTIKQNRHAPPLRAQPPIFVQKHLHTQKMLQTPKDEDWAGVAQPAWTRPGFESTDD